RAVGLQPQTSGPGAAWSWSSEPFGADMLGQFAGKIALKFGRAELLPRLAVRELKTTLRFDKNELALENATGDLARGRISGGITFRSAEDGLSAHAKISLTDADAGALLLPSTANVHFIAERPPVSGSLGLTAEVEGTGMSPVALVGSLKGSGKIVLADGQIAGLDPHTFDAVTQAVDQGLAIESGPISNLVSESLESDQLSIKRIESAMHITAGQLRLGNVAAESQDAGLSIAGILDLTDGSIDSRLVLSGSSTSAGARPKIFVALKGPLTAPSRRIDVSALTGWLTSRAVENQTKQLGAIESVPPESRGLPMPKKQTPVVLPAPKKQAPVLPAQIDILPAPAPRSTGQPARSVGSQN
ncbi:MAG TPA: AsmA-like C-terminal region-containing protein, partial [Pseudolabrys sp.]